ncbi:MAG: YebG family protein [Gammaproteobacteria bacterium]|uniref:YebG family protein n=1 Tax=Pseudomaricurvus alcaniphilus TaxID=1166482 RepID=UPI001408E1C1|nr:YebG family protein [Pseudomaricurvus alcaniphilus]MBR9913189.1 YebG family protein [Gammaproteobacteria bacterium]NHN35771.1 YebG family protein [Pseudomaricurvus alcaniphilus]
MAVIAVWKCDRDGKMFDDKKAADEHDKMLEFAANVTAVIEREVKSVDEAAAEEIGLLFAKHRELLAKACKGKPEALLEMNTVASADAGNVTSLAASK